MDVRPDPLLVTAEGDLLEQARAGDVAAFERLLRGHDDRLRALAYRMMGDRAAMDDALQDAYVRAFRGIGRFRGDAAFATWMHRIVATTCLDHLRRRKRWSECTSPSDEPDIAPAGGHVRDPGDAVSRQLDLRRALGRLPADQRAALLLVDGEGFSYHEAGEALGVPAGTVSSRITRARRAMRELLAPSHSEPPEDER